MASTALHVTGLPANSAEDQVKAVFAQYGAVSNVKVLPQRDDKPDGAAIVEMENAEQAKFLVENVSGTVPRGMAGPVTIKKKIVNDWGKGYGKGYMPPWAYAQMMWYYSKGGYKGRGKGGGLRSFPAEKKVWVGNIPEEGVTFRELQAHFPGSKFAVVMKGKSAGTGGVAFATPEEATQAIQTLNGSTLGGNVIQVDLWTKKEPEESKEAS